MLWGSNKDLKVVAEQNGDLGQITPIPNTCSSPIEGFHRPGPGLRLHRIPHLGTKQGEERQKYTQGSQDFRRTHTIIPPTEKKSTKNVLSSA